MASPEHTARHNAAAQMGSMTIHDYWNRPTNLAFHDLTTTITPPPNLKSLLGLGLKFIPTPFRTNTFTKINQEGTGLPALARSLRLRCFFCAVGEPTTNMEFNPKLHVKSNWEPPDKYYIKLLRNRMTQFEIRLRKLFKPRKSVPNLSPTHRYTLEYLRSQQDFIIANCDKNLGPAIIERDQYIKLAYRDHLSDSTTYERLSKNAANIYIQQNKYRLSHWLTEHKEELTEQEYHFIEHHSSQVEDPLPYFYLTMKVHKKPLKSRPIVSFSGSLFHSLGVWIDTHLQKVAKSFPSYIESSFDLIKDFRNLNLPLNCRIFTADAVSMYANIDTETAITAIHDYIVANQNKFPYLPVTPLTEALEIIMRHNVFQFGDTFWKQLSGTAMGAPPAPTYANASFATHENTILPKYQNQLAYYKRYIDDVFGIWIPHPSQPTDTLLWQEFQRDINSWNGLDWIFSPRSEELVFLDVNISLQDQKLKTTLYEKPMNLHLYLSSRSSHPPGVLHGLIAGHIYRAFSLCTDTEDAQESVRKMWKYLRDRGYSKATLQPIFDTELKKRQSAVATESAVDTTKQWFFKLSYHPQDPPSRDIRKAWEDAVATPRLAKPLKDIDMNWTPLGHHRFIVCYTRPPNLGNLLSYRKLQPDSGPPVSSFFE